MTPTGNALQDQQVLVNADSVSGDQMHSSVTINDSGIMVVWTSQNSAGSWDLWGNAMTTRAM